MRISDWSSDVGSSYHRLAEEVEDLGKSERKTRRSHLRRIIEHCLKLEWSPATDPRGSWRRSISQARLEIEGRMTATLRREMIDDIPWLYDGARRLARDALKDHGEAAAAAALPTARSEEHTYDLQSLMLASYAV